jgi:hypothetical protein
MNELTKPKEAVVASRPADVERGLTRISSLTLNEEAFMATQSAVMATKAAIAQAAYKAYETKDRAALEAIIADDFHFTSPLDNRIDRATYFRRCWPNSEWIAGFDFIDVVAHGDRVFVTYEARKTDGGRFRNTEVLTIRDRRLVDVEVYFGWSLPHKAPQGGFVDPPPQKS